MKIYTRTGDRGTTGLYSGERLSKADLRFEVLGTLDELNAAIGLARASGAAPEVSGLLREVQIQLFQAGADFATRNPATLRVGDREITWLEAQIDQMTAVLPGLTSFILPTGHPAAAHLHTARAICRRAERFATQLSLREPLSPVSLAYLNRLSDFLFTIARWQNHLSGIAEDPWLPES